MRTRRNSGIIGREKKIKSHDQNGVYTLDDPAYLKQNSILTHESSIKGLPQETWSEYGGNYDPYLNEVRIHFRDSEFSNTMLKDQSSGNWESWMTGDQYYRNPVATNFGPRYRDWCTNFWQDSYYDVNDYAQIRFGTNNFTIEFWIKRCVQDGVVHYVMGKGGNAGVTAGTGWVIGINTTYFPFWYDAQGNTTITSNTAILIDTWYHLAFVRTGTGANGMRIFLDGVLVGIGTSSGNFTDTNLLRIGCDRVATGWTSRFGGRLSDIRIHNATFLNYVTANTTLGTTIFARPTAALDETASSVVFSQSMKKPHHDDIPGRHPQTISLATVVQITSQDNRTSRMIDSPFLNNTVMLTGNGSGSLYDWDRNNWYRVYDHNSSAALARTGFDLRFGTSAFTVEAWVYITADRGDCAIAGKGTGNDTSGSGWSFWIDGSGYLRWSDNSVSINSSPNNPLRTCSWYHVAASRAGTGASQFNMYVNGGSTFQGTVSTNYTDTAPLRLFASRNEQYVHMGYICGLRISRVARYTGTTSFDVDTTTFIDNSMTVDANTMLLIGTCGNNENTNGFEHWFDSGTLRHGAPVRFANEVEEGSQHPYERRGHSIGVYPSGTQRLFIADAGTNFNFGTGDFSIEFWFRSGYQEEDTTTFRTLMCSQTNYNDTGLWIRLTHRRSYEVHTGNNIRLTDNLHYNTAFLWNHMVIQRVNGQFALYINGKKRHEIMYTSNITSPIGGLSFFNAASSNHYNNNLFIGYVADIRVNKGTAAYAAGNAGVQGNPTYIDLPTRPLSTITGTVFLWTGPSYMDYSGNNNGVEAGGRTRLNYTSSWDTYVTNFGPYKGIPYDRTKQWRGATTDTGQGCQNQGPLRGDTTYPDYAWITHLKDPWTIEMWHFPYQSNPGAPNNDYQSWGTANTAGHEGWRIRVNANSSGSISPQDVVFEFYTNHNSGIQRLGTSGQALMNFGSSHGWNYYVIQYDPIATTKMALFVNGRRVATSATFTPGQRMWNTYRLQTLGQQGVGPIRISRVARYNNDSTTHTMPTERWIYDQHTFASINIDGPFQNIGTVICTRQYGVLPSFRYKRFGNASLKFSQKEPTTLCDRIYSDNTTFNTRQLDSRRYDFTVECWAMSWDQPIGGATINANGRALWMWWNNILVRITNTGYWRFSSANSANDGSNFPLNYSYANQDNTTVYYASNATIGTFDHIVMCRRAGNFYFYINGVQAHVMYGTATGTYPSAGPTQEVGFPDYASNLGPSNIYFNIGHETYGYADKSWSGYMQDLRVTHVARYDTRVVEWRAKSITIVGSSGYIIQASANITGICMRQQINFSSSFGAISSGTNYFVRNVFDNFITVATAIGQVAVNVGTTTGLNVTATTTTTNIDTMVHKGTDIPALPTALFPTK